jgi:hypothetical protein
MNQQTQAISDSPQRPRRFKMAMGWIAALLVVAAICGAFERFNKTTPQQATAKPIWYEAPENQPLPKAQPLKAAHSTMPAPAPAASPISAEDKARALGQLARIDRLLRDYRRAYGEFPVGSNIDITRTLRGDNEKKIIFVTPEEAPINAKGELIDAWKTPYFFHQISASHMEIFSPGPDRRMWTADDLKVTAQ